MVRNLLNNIIITICAVTNFLGLIKVRHTIKQCNKVTITLIATPQNFAIYKASGGSKYEAIGTP